MRCTLKILLSVAVATAWQPKVQAIGTGSTKDQYQTIPERNVFGLKQPDAQPQAAADAPAPLPKIILTGITTILESKRALMKVAAAAGGKQVDPTKELSLILSEGQREGDIEVLQIDEKSGSVKVNNSGTVMVLTFEKDGAKLPATAPPAGTNGAAPIPAALPSVLSTNPFALPGRGAPGMPGRNPRRGAPPVPGVAASTGVYAPAVGGVPTATGVTPAPVQSTAPTPGQDLTPEEQAIVLEMQRQAGVNNSALLPPTPLTPQGTQTQPNEAAPAPAPTTPAYPGRPAVLVPQ